MRTFCLPGKPPAFIIECDTCGSSSLVSAEHKRYCPVCGPDVIASFKVTKIPREQEEPIEYMDRIRAFIRDQMKKELWDRVGFDFKGQRVTNPWRSPDALSEHSTEEAIDRYGVDNILFFIEEAAEKAGLSDIEFPDEGILIASIKDINGYSIEIRKHGTNDYTACFAAGHNSVRGNTANIAGEIEGYLIQTKKQYIIDRISLMNPYSFDEIFPGLEKLTKG